MATSSFSFWKSALTLCLLVPGKRDMVFFRFLKKSKGEAAAHQFAHVRNHAFVGRHEDKVVLEFPNLAIRPLVLEDLCNVRRRLAQI
jgi:hypothetical protein